MKDLYPEGFDEDMLIEKPCPCNCHLQLTSPLTEIWNSIESCEHCQPK